ncbi:MAG: hypothetical protein HUU13_09440 [Burkholderiaceae bacterium]|nr:hypothetical protein [Burkholderiaceae bacterium]
MKSRFKPVQPLGRRTVLAASAAMVLSAWATPLMAQSGRKNRVTLNSVLRFDETTWARLVEKGPRPAAYIFTTTYCPSCPDAFEKVMAFVMQARRPVELVVVLMDVQGKAALEHASHYVGATRLYTFEGFESAIRQSVDPKWPNVTPYIVLLGRDGGVQRSIGVPEEAALKRWLP